MSLVIAGSCVVFAAHIPLYVGIVRKKLNPSLATWGMWSVMGSMVFLSQLKAGKEDPWGMLAAAIGTILAFILLLFYGKREWSRFDTKCLALSSAGVVIWLIAGPTVAQIAFLSALFIAGIPTVKKAWKNPEDESALAWGMFTAGFFMTVVAVPAWSWAGFVVWLQPVLSTLFNGLIFILALRPERRKAL